ncbi:unknown similar to AMEV045 [Choristoneura biennis entomopoxvirus]|uniref:Uncharacterized protein n=1 Tax=Choristoneura biennis entomopoxvirus TaxID=10288 RepID=A0A916KPE9_CBEPV|nr:unknown similar to AMEV045 [Choristoneura biennis entomopoxvirus]CCU55646.1 unknown similar to AMEV045 [Choristoneura biennis entomopoxvirus]
MISMYMLILNILLLSIKLTFCIGTIPYVCDPNANFTDLKLPSATNCDINSAKYSTINASLWEKNYIDVDSMLYRNIIRSCEYLEINNKIKLNIIHTGFKYYNYIKDDTFEYPSNVTYEMLDSLNNDTNLWLINECKHKTSGEGRYSEIIKFKHRFYSDYNVMIINDISHEKIAKQIMLNCDHVNQKNNKTTLLKNTESVNYNLQFNKGYCVYKINNAEYKYLWNTNNYNKDNPEVYYLPNNIIYNNIFPYKLLNENVNLKLTRKYIIIPSLDIIFKNVKKKYNYNNYMICFENCKYIITYPINSDTICKKTDIQGDTIIYNDYYSCNTANLTLTNEIWSTVFLNKYNYTYNGFNTSTHAQINPEKLNGEHKEIYEDLFGNSIYVNIYDDDTLENSVLQSQIDYSNLQIQDIIDNEYILCNKILMHKKLIDALCNVQPYDCISALLGIKNLKVFKDYNIFKVKQCTIVDDYKFNFEAKFHYDNERCYYDIPIKYKLNNTEFTGYYNVHNGEIFSKSYLTNDCPTKYYIELNNILYVVDNSTMKEADININTIHNHKATLDMSVYEDIIPQINKIKDLPNFQDIKSFENSDDVYSQIIAQDETIHIYIPPTIDFSGISNFFKHMFDSPLKIISSICVIILIAFSLFLICICLPYIKSCCDCIIKK